MPSDLQTFEVARSPAGISQSSPNPTPRNVEELKNFQVYRGRSGLRAPFNLVATLQDDQGTPANVTSVVDIEEHAGQLWTLSHSTNTNDVYLHSMDYDGTSLTLETVVYTGVSSKPLLTLTSFSGGTASSPVARLYIADYDQSQVSKFWDSDGDTLTTVAEDLDNDSSDEDVKFSLMLPYKFHLWGTGFFEGTATRPEMLRFSQPGLIPGADPGGGNNNKEWFSADHRSVGRRGDKITSLSKAGDIMIAFQNGAAHAIFGTGANTWTREELSGTVGCVGPKASTSVEKVCYFWSPEGPYRTDGSQLQYIGGPIEEIIAADIDFAEDDTVVGYSPQNKLVHFIVTPSGQDSYQLGLIFDHRVSAWAKAEWLVGASTPAEFSSLARGNA